MQDNQQDCNKRPVIITQKNLANLIYSCKSIVLSQWVPSFFRKRVRMQRNIGLKSADSIIENQEIYLTSENFLEYDHIL